LCRYSDLNNKNIVIFAPGEDEIALECLKMVGPCLLNQLHKLINAVWEQEEIPESWQISFLCPVFKN